MRTLVLGQWVTSEGKGESSEGGKEGRRLGELEERQRETGLGGEFRKIFLHF